MSFHRTECCSDAYGDDKFCRSVLYPRGFKDGLFDPAQFLEIQKSDENPGVSVMSISSAFLLKDAGAIHAYGCLTAQRANERIAERSEDSPDPTKRRRYLGYYSFTRRIALGLSSNFHDVGVECRPEDYGDCAHFQFELYQKEVQSATKRDYRNDKVDIRIALDLLMSGPHRHVCECDEEERSMLEEIDLPLRPIPSE